MAPLPLARRWNRWICAVGVTASLVAGGALAQQAPTARKPPPRLPPSPSEQARIPAGVDTGTPGTSDTLPLGTPVPPSISADRGESKMRSAAARAAARKSGPTAAGLSPASAATAGCANVGPSGNPNGEAVALPGSGFTGQSASPKTAAAIDKRPVGRVAC